VHLPQRSPKNTPTCFVFYSFVICFSLIFVVYFFGHFSPCWGSPKKYMAFAPLDFLLFAQFLYCVFGRFVTRGIKKSTQKIAGGIFFSFQTPKKGITSLGRFFLLPNGAPWTYQYQYTTHQPLPGVTKRPSGKLRRRVLYIRGMWWWQYMAYGAGGCGYAGIWRDKSAW
jgi:hypothetical protein